MAHETPRFKFTTFDAPTDSLAYKGYKFSDADRAFLDSLLAYAAEQHLHTGQPAGTEQSPTAPLLNLSTTGGSLPPNTPVYYRYGIVDSSGQERLGSKIAPAFTAPSLTAPSRPSVTDGTELIPGGYQGTLPAGRYTYAVSAYGPNQNQETLVSESTGFAVTDRGAAAITIPGPFLSVVGFNVYRKGPTDNYYQFLTSVPIGAAVDSVHWVDDGVANPDPLRGAPTANTSSSSNSITVTPPAALAAGQTWRVYRSYSSDSWDNTLLAWNAGTAVVDTGVMGNAAGTPITGSSAVGSPPKIDVITEMVGDLPASLLTAYETASIPFSGQVVVGPSATQWVNDYKQMCVVGLRASLAKGSMPASQELRVRLEYLDGAVWVPYPELAKISVGATVGARVAVATSVALTWTPGKQLRANVTQAGGGATPTDRDLVLTMTVVAIHK